VRKTETEIERRDGEGKTKGRERLLSQEAESMAVLHCRKKPASLAEKEKVHLGKGTVTRTRTLWMCCCGKYL
jgi:hypothetical protein